MWPGISASIHIRHDTLQTHHTIESRCRSRDENGSNDLLNIYGVVKEKKLTTVSSYNAPDSQISTSTDSGGEIDTPGAPPPRVARPNHGFMDLVVKFLYKTIF
jgi:hypothetical protein